MGAVLQRSILRTSRLLDFASENDPQIGRKPEDWPLVVRKELVDHAIDACEEAGVPPEITVSVAESGISVADNGPGILAKTVEGVLDSSVRVSSRDAYVTPDRGAQGNALKTIVAMPFASHVEIEAGGIRHDIDFRIGRIPQAPAIQVNRDASDVRTGTGARVCWPVSARSILLDARERVLEAPDDLEIAVTEGLRSRLTNALKEKPARSWDSAVREIGTEEGEAEA